MNQASAAAGIDYKFVTRIEMLDGGNGASTPNVLETWECVGCFLQSVDYGSLNYGSNEIVTVDLTIKIDNATQSPIGTGVGSAVARKLGTVITG
jgi:tetrahydromethanopterin S-methyltransferase subunit H